MKFLLIIPSILIIVFSILGGEGTFINPFEMSLMDQYIIKNIRIPRVLLSFMVGSILAMSGWSYQILFKNPLATPYTLGISSICAFAMALSELLAGTNPKINPNFVFILCLLPFILVILFGLYKKISKERLLLFGVCIGIFSSSAIVFIQTLLGNESIARLTRWMMGSLNVVGFDDIFLIFPLFILLVIAFSYYKKSLTLISISDEFAMARKVNVQKVGNRIVLLTTLLIAGVVWICGPIGFVGLIIPHLVKKLYDSDFSKNYLVSLFLGGSFLCICDLLSRSISSEQVIPIGAITAFIGAPLLVYRLIKKPV